MNYIIIVLSSLTAGILLEYLLGPIKKVVSLVAGTGDKISDFGEKVDNIGDDLGEKVDNLGKKISKLDDKDK